MGGEIKQGRADLSDRGNVDVSWDLKVPRNITDVDISIWNK